jgi:hypothetical protein
MSEPSHIVVRDGDILLRHLGGIPSPNLLDLCNDGQAHEAWPCEWPNAEGGVSVQWRSRDDAWDAEHKPADVPYVFVRAGRNPRYKEFEG